MQKNKMLIAVGLIIIATFGRIIPHPWNMTPVVGAAIFAGVKLGKRYAVIVPFVAMILGDLILGFYQWQMLLSVYFSMAVIGGIAYSTRHQEGKTVFLLRPIAASVLFFLVTNAAVCFFGTMYPHSLTGLVASYVAGLPFFGRDLVGNLLYTSLFFGVYEYVTKRSFIEKKMAQVALATEN
jgi:hypothetical protein